MPPGNSFDSIELPASRERAGLTRSFSAGLSSISGSIRPREVRLAISTVGSTASIGPGAWWITKPIQLLPGLGRADLRGLHEADPLRRVAGRQRIHDGAQIGRARGAVPPGLGRGARAEPAMRIRPFRHRQVGIGPHAPPPGAQDVLGPVESRGRGRRSGRCRSGS
jgi:hypothetical protein